MLLTRGFFLQFLRDRLIGTERHGEIFCNRFGFVSHQRRAAPDHFVYSSLPPGGRLALRDSVSQIVTLHAALKDKVPSLAVRKIILGKNYFLLGCACFLSPRSSENSYRGNQQ